MPQLSIAQAMDAWGGQYINGISAPMSELEDRMTKVSETDTKTATSVASSVTRRSGTFPPSQLKRRKAKVVKKKKRGKKIK